MIMEGFWLFSFERLNGMLGKMPNNNRLIEPQLMQPFIQEKLAFSLPFPSEFNDLFEPVCTHNDRLVGSLLELASPQANSIAEIQFPSNSKKAIFTQIFPLS